MRSNDSSMEENFYFIFGKADIDLLINKIKSVYDTLKVPRKSIKIP